MLLNRRIPRRPGERGNHYFGANRALGRDGVTSAPSPSANLVGVRGARPAGPRSQTAGVPVVGNRTSHSSKSPPPGKGFAVLVRPPAVAKGRSEPRARSGAS